MHTLHHGSFRVAAHSTATDPTIWQAATGVLGIVWAMMFYQYRRLGGRVDAVGGRVDEVEKINISREELNKIVTAQRTEFNGVVGSLRQDIKDMGKSIHSRQDDLMRFLMEHANK